MWSKYYITNPIIQSAIDMHSTMPITTFNTRYCFIDNNDSYKVYFSSNFEIADVYKNNIPHMYDIINGNITIRDARPNDFIKNFLSKEAEILINRFLKLRLFL